MSSEIATQGPGGRRRPVLIGLGVALLGVAIALLLFGSNLFRRDDDLAAPLQSIPAFAGTAESQVAPLEPDLAGLPEVGDLAPDFVLADLDGNEVRLSDYAGETVILNFWATWCAPCRVEMPELQAVQEDYAFADVNVLAVNQGEDAERVRDFYDEVGLSLPGLLDSDGKVGQTYGAFFLPSTLFINPDGEITVFHRGIISRKQVEDYLQRTLPIEGS